MKNENKRTKMTHVSIVIKKTVQTILLIVPIFCNFSPLLCSQTQAGQITCTQSLANPLETMLKNFHPKIEKAMVIISPSYNNSLWYKQNLDATVNQNYKNYRIICIDDASPDNTGTLIENYIKEKKLEHKVTLIQNKTRQYALANWYQAIHSCQDHEIIVMVDGDDHLAHPNVLSLLNKVYQDPHVWLSYGSFKKSIDEPTNIHHSEQIPTNIIKDNAFRHYPWFTSHLRTCYSWLFKHIKKEDLMHEGKFYPMMCDHAMMFPMLEMAGTHSSYIPDTLLIYNNENPINIHKIHEETRHTISALIREAQKYQPLTKAPVKN